PAAVVEADDGHTHFERLVHERADLAGVGLAQRAAAHGEVLAEDSHRPPVDGPEARDHAVPRHGLEAEGRRAALDELALLDEAALVEEQVEPLARGELALLVLGLDA